MICGNLLGAAAQTNDSKPTAQTQTVGQPQLNDERSSKPEPPENLAHLGDVVDVDLLGSTEYDWRGKLDDAGALSSLPNLVEPITALCRSESEIAADIAAAYAKFVRSPRIVVSIVDRSARPVATLLGAIRAPQRFSIQRPIKLNEMLILSGGITDRASGEVVIFRPPLVSCAQKNQPQPTAQTITARLSDLLAGKPEANPFVRAGDVVTVEEAASVYVIGSVAAPQPVLFRAGLTAARAINTAGGLNRSAENGKITIFRRQAGQANSTTITGDYAKISNRQETDIELKPFDIIEVASNGRQKVNRPPIINAPENAPLKPTELPLRVIN